MFGEGSCRRHDSRVRGQGCWCSSWSCPRCEPNGRVPGTTVPRAAAEGRPVQTGTAAELARLSSREGTRSQVRSDHANLPRGCMSPSPSRGDGAQGLRFHDGGGRGDILIRRLCVLEGGLSPAGDAIPFAQDAGGADAYSSSGVRKRRDNLFPSHISSWPRSQIFTPGSFTSFKLSAPSGSRCCSPAQRLGQQSPALRWSFSSKCWELGQPRVSSGRGDSRGDSSSSSSPPGSE